MVFSQQLLPDLAHLPTSPAPHPLFCSVFRKQASQTNVNKQQQKEKASEIQTHNKNLRKHKIGNQANGQ